MNTALVIGYGSIGKLHCAVLADLGYQVRIVSNHARGEPNGYPTIAAALEAAAEEPPQYAVIASQTHSHEDDLRQLRAAGYDGKVVVEKPLFMRLPDEPVPGKPSIYVGYNLRFHPALTELKRQLADKSVLTAHHYVGQHLSQWRPGSDHLKSYSAHKAEGGGVLRDLSHELDLMQFLFGSRIQAKAIGGKLGNATRDADDAYGFVMQYDRCPLITLQMNCLDHFGGRQLKIVCEDTSFDLDFSSGKLRSGDREETYPAARETSYRLMHEDILNAEVPTACSFEEGMEILRLFESIEST